MMWWTRQGLAKVEFGYGRRTHWNGPHGPWSGLVVASGSLAGLAFLAVLVVRGFFSAEVRGDITTEQTMSLRGVTVTCAHSWRDRRLVMMMRALQAKGAAEGGWDEQSNLLVTAGPVTGELCILARDPGALDHLLLLAAGDSPQNVADMAAERWLTLKPRPGWDLSRLGVSGVQR